MAAGWRTVLLAVSTSLKSQDGFGTEMIGHNLMLTLSLWSALSLQPGQLVWPVTNDDKCLTNHWVMIKFTQIASSSFPSIAFYDTHAKPRQGPATMLRTRCLCLASWQISEARTYRKYALTHMWRQRGAAILEWFRAEPKKHGRSRHSWSFLTESRNSINTPRYQPFPLSLTIYFCSIQQLLEGGLFFTQLMKKGYWTWGRVGRVIALMSALFFFDHST